MTEIQNKILRGIFGRLWVNDRLMAHLKSFECKVTGSYETVDVNGELCEQQRFVGYGISGTMVLHKVDSGVARLVAEGYQSGVMPTIKFVARLDDPSISGSERVEIYNVTFDEFMMIQFENKAIGEESVPFKAGGFKYLDTISEI